MGRRDRITEGLCGATVERTGHLAEHQGFWRIGRASLTVGTGWIRHAYLHVVVLNRDLSAARIVIIDTHHADAVMHRLRSHGAGVPHRAGVGEEVGVRRCCHQRLRQCGYGQCHHRTIADDQRSRCAAAVVRIVQRRDHHIGAELRRHGRQAIVGHIDRAVNWQTRTCTNRMRRTEMLLQIGGDYRDRAWCATDGHGGAGRAGVVGIGDRGHHRITSGIGRRRAAAAVTDGDALSHRVGGRCCRFRRAVIVVVEPG